MKATLSCKTRQMTHSELTACARILRNPELQNRWVQWSPRKRYLLSTGTGGGHLFKIGSLTLEGEWHTDILIIRVE